MRALGVGGWMAGVVWAVLLGAAVVACLPGGGGGGGGGAGLQNDAFITVTPAGGVETTVSFDSAISEITVTPPVDRTFTTSFVNHDPLVTVEIRINGNVVTEGDELTYPLSGARVADDARVVVTFNGRTYTSARSGADGNMTVNLLTVTDNAVDFRASFNLTLVADDSSTLALSGFLESHYGNTALDGEDAGF